ncbi:MAG: rRNA maturation RNase YbeY [Clostridiales bacterium]|nr:rRNA maturation RNase YbeY [Clostridiales bacterium]
MKILLSINNKQKTLPVTAGLRALWRGAAARVLRAAGFDAVKQAEISLLLCDDDYIRELNKSFRGKDAPTDVLSFPQLDDFDEAAGQNLLLGDIVISCERALAQAEEFAHSRERELVFLFVHGLLHLLGHDHETEDDESEMRGLQALVMEQMALPR